MTQRTDSTPTPEAPQAGDPRYDFGNVSHAVRSLIEGTAPADLPKPTPCPDYDVSHLIDHLVLVMKRVAHMGDGGVWSDVDHVDHEGVEAKLAAWTAAGHAVMEAWADPATLEQICHAPFGDVPGAPVLYTYTAELATHAWDLSTATERTPAIADEFLQGAWVAVQNIPADGREDPMIPFGPVVNVADTAPLQLQIAGWMGRPVGG